MPCNEANLLLAIAALNRGQIKSVAQAAATFKVPRTTLRARRAGIAMRRDCQPSLKKLTKLEEEVIVRYILDLDSRGFAPSYAAVRDMADKLLTARGATPVGKLWPHTFVRRTEALTTRFNRPYDYQRALCEDPVIISAWFERVQRFKEEHRILDEDTYNFDEVGFAMGKLSPHLVVTGSERRRSRPMALQPGDREWVTAVVGINAGGWSIPPYIILKG